MLQCRLVAGPKERHITEFAGHVTVFVELGQAGFVDRAVLAVGCLTAAGALDLVGMVEIP